MRLLKNKVHLSTKTFLASEAMMLRNMIWPEGVFMDKPHYGNHHFSPLNSRVYFILIFERTPLRNVNSPITNRITKMKVADTFVPGAF